MLRKEMFMNYHVVKPGDTIYKLAQMYNVSVEAIIEANPGINPNMLTIGQIICIPLGPKEECPPGTSSYTIRKGDTLYLIAKKYDIPLNLLIKSNPNVNPNNLIVGEVLCIPIHWSSYKSKLYRISFKYPSSWEKVAEDYYEGPTGYFIVSAINSDLPLGKLCEEEAYQNLKPYGSEPSIMNVKVDNQEGCLIMPSKDQTKEMDNQAALIVKYPKPIMINEIEYNYVIIWAEKNHIQGIKNTLHFVE